MGYNHKTNRNERSYHYLLALDNNSNSLQYDGVIHRLNERQEMYREFGIEK